jgi:hypothetical protein
METNHRKNLTIERPDFSSATPEFWRALKDSLFQNIAIINSDDKTPPVAALEALEQYSPELFRELSRDIGVLMIMQMKQTAPTTRTVQ